MLYIDTSLLVSSLTSEPDSPRIQVWLERETAGGGLISWLVETEFSAALSVKLRRGDINQGERAAARQGFVDLIATALTSVPVERHHYQLAANFADRHSLGLRAADALHLAIVYDNAPLFARSTGDCPKPVRKSVSTRSWFEAGAQTIGILFLAGSWERISLRVCAPTVSFSLALR